MSIDNFFNKMDSKINSINTENKKLEEKQNDLRDFFENEIKSITPILEEYKKNLEERNIKCKLTIGTTNFSLNLFYKDGGHRGISFSQNFRSKYKSYSFTTLFTNDDHKNYTGTDGISITKENWSHGNVKSRIEDCIEDFIFYSTRHNGY